MVGVEPAPALRGLHPGKVSARRSWPPGCGRFPPPPPRLPAAGDGDGGPSGVNQEDVVGVAGVNASSVSCNGSLSHPLAQPEREVKLLSDGKDNGQVELLDGQGENRVAEGMAEGSDVAVADVCCMENGREGTGLLLMEEKRVGGNGGLERKGAVGDGDSGDLGRGGIGELERLRGGGDKKRWLMSVMHPPPKRRAIFAKRSFPPGCGRVAVTPLQSCAGEEGLQLDVTPTTNDGAFVADALAIVPVLREGVALVSRKDVYNGMHGKCIQDEGASMEHHGIQESQIDVDVALSDSGRDMHDNACQPNVVTEASPKIGFDEKMNEKRLQQEGNSAKRVIVNDDKARGKCEGIMQAVDIEASMQNLDDDESTKGKRVFGSDKIDDTVEVYGEGKMRSKTSITHREVVLPAKVKQKKLAHKLNNDVMNKAMIHSSHRSVEETKLGKSMVNNLSEEDDALNFLTDKLVGQALMTPDKCPRTQGRKTIMGVSYSLDPKSKLKKQDNVRKKQLHKKVVPSSSLIVREKLENDEASYLEDEDDDDDSKALVVHEGKHELCVNLPPCVPFERHHRQSGDQDADARSKVRRILKLFQLICRKLVQAEEQRSFKVGRIDLEAGKIIRKFREFTKSGPIMGNVPGVEVGDEFHFRVELAIVGLHRPYQGGIDTMKENGVLIAISIVASGGYPDELSTSDELIYTGSGGKPVGKKEAEDQKLERGNLALKNCITTKTPVRVIHGFKGQSRGDASRSRTKQISTFTYDGLYVVVDCWQEGLKGSMVFKYKLQRIPGQPELALHIVKATRKSKVREGLCMPDISQKKERIPISVINTIDDMRPAPFKYITKIIYPSWYAKERPRGCDCTNGCSDSSKCACAVKNGGEIPFNFNGAIVHAKPLIYECGPSCRCPPTCHNRVSQHGIKISLEIFRTGKTGWGVRSLSSISSGSFICEYVGQLLQDKEAEQSQNDEYLFDIGHNYDDEDLWKGLPSIIPGLESSGSCTETMKDVGFTIDAAECGNIGRFINHSCSPNLYAQNVLWDHDDKRMPHIMFFAAENIPPLQELTYHYNYTIGQVHDNNGEEKVKHCYCGSSECCGRLY